MNLTWMLMMIIMMIYYLIQLINKLNNFKNSYNSLESSFNNLNNSKLNMSMNFTLIMIIFILFDIETMIIIPMMINQFLNNKNYMFTNLFLMFIMLTTMIELKNNKIKWML